MINNKYFEVPPPRSKSQPVLREFDCFKRYICCKMWRMRKWPGSTKRRKPGQQSTVSRLDESYTTESDTFFSSYSNKKAPPRLNHFQQQVYAQQIVADMLPPQSVYQAPHMMQLPQYN